MTLEEAYKQGFLAGIKAYAWWSFGRQEVGITGTLLTKAQAEVEKTLIKNLFLFKIKL